MRLEENPKWNILNEKLDEISKIVQESENSFVRMLFAQQYGNISKDTITTKQVDECSFLQMMTRHAYKFVNYYVKDPRRCLRRS